MSSPHRPSPYRPATPPLGQHQSQYQDWSTTALNGLQGPPASVQSHFAGYSQAQPVAPAPYNAPYPYQHHQPSARHDPPSRWHPSTAEGSATHGSVPPPNALSQGLYAAPTSFPVHSVPHPQASMYPGSYEAANSWALRPEASLTDYQGTGTWGGGVDASGELYQIPDPRLHTQVNRTFPPNWIHPDDTTMTRPQVELTSHFYAPPTATLPPHDRISDPSHGAFKAQPQYTPFHPSIDNPRAAYPTASFIDPTSTISLSAPPVVPASLAAPVPPPPQRAPQSAQAFAPQLAASSHTFSYPTGTVDPYRPTSSGKSSVSSPDAGVSPASTTSTLPSPSSAPFIAAAVTNRIRLESLSAASSPTSSSNNRKAIAPKKPSAARPAYELVADCRLCGLTLGKLTLRGGGAGEHGREYEGDFFCFNCIPLPITLDRRKPSLACDNEATYADTLSAAVDRFQGLSVKETPERKSSTSSSRSAGGTPIGGKKRSKVEEKIVTCDVCRTDLGTGEPRLVGGYEGAKLEAGVETLCDRCESKYLRCSDCGGGGGTRGVGRWRAREMFPVGRRTCQLSHVRLGTPNEMTYDIWPITSIPPDQIEELIERCRDLYHITLLATLAVPDMLESPAPLATTFAEVEKLAHDSWTMWEPLIRVDIEAASSTRRYIALRWSPTPSHKAKLKKEGVSAHPNPNDPPTLIRPGYILAGYILGEMDLMLGSLHVALTLPAGSGESYDAASRLMQSLFRHVQNDISSINHQRQQKQAPLLPELFQAWTMHMIKKDSRVMNRLEKGRGFLALDEYVNKYPETDVTHFAPHRPVFLPPELLKGWFVWVKRLDSDESWLSSSSRKRVKDDEY